MITAKEIHKANCTHAKMSPWGGSAPQGLVSGLLSLMLVIKPFANVVSDYACSDGQQEIQKAFHCTHLPTVSRQEKDSKTIIPIFDRVHNAWKGIFQKPLA